MDRIRPTFSPPSTYKALRRIWLTTCGCGGGDDHRSQCSAVIDLDALMKDPAFDQGAAARRRR